ncbi:MAG: hypothetical protein WKF84_16755 [Pyrinomonadaceae bacterium]
MNIGEDQTLEGYFTDQLVANRASLAKVESERTRVSRTVREARDASIATTKLETTRTRLTQERALLAAREASLSRLQIDLKAISPNNGGSSSNNNRLRDMQTRMLGLDGELKVAREAASRAAELETQRARLREIEDEGKRKKEERAELGAAADAIALLEVESGEVEQRLQSLKDPRSRAASLRAEGAREESLRVELDGALSASESLRTQHQILQKQLSRFAALDAGWAQSSAVRDHTEADYREYLACELAAKSLDARRVDYERVSVEAAQNVLESEAAQAGLRACRVFVRPHAPRRGACRFSTCARAGCGGRCTTTLNARRRRNARRRNFPFGSGAFDAAR